MIQLTESGYVLRQIEGQNITYVTTPEGEVVKAISGKLTQRTAPAIILSLRKPADY